jgi:hypothetical protein
MIVSGLSSNILAARGDRETAFDFIPAGTVIQSDITLGTAALKLGPPFRPEVSA